MAQQQDKTRICQKLIDEFAEIMERIAAKFCANSKITLPCEAGDLVNRASKKLYDYCISGKINPSDVDGGLVHEFIYREFVDCYRIGRRHQRNAVAIAGQLGILNPPVDPIGRMINNAILMVCIDELPPKNKEVIMYYFFEDLTLEEIKPLIHVSTTTVFNRCKKALKILKKCIGQDPSE